METSGCDAVMIGRGALGNPWIYRAIAQSIDNQSPADHKPSFFERKEAALKHFELTLATEGEKMGVLKSRKILCWYFKNCPGAAELRNKINTAETAAAMRSIVENYEVRNGQP
ncbi:MAG: hypothetical protein A2Z83_06910 [Omnitrophica bacterium GWA2_52_8]|nr:MAG: hypothetical protein A2Z83_06910 [Omnitrophica bacterium GWA2_52_8]